MTDDTSDTATATDAGGPDGTDDSDAGAEPGERVSGSFVVTHAEADNALLRDARTARVHPLSENPGLSSGVVLDGTLRSEPPIGATWTVAERDEVRKIPVRAVELSPTTQSRTVADDQPVGELTRVGRAGEGELHVLTVPESETDAAVADAVDDEATLARAARLGVAHVEVRSEPGLVVVRYLPD